MGAAVLIGSLEGGVGEGEGGWEPGGRCEWMGAWRAVRVWVDRSLEGGVGEGVDGCKLRRT